MKKESQKKLKPTPYHPKRFKKNKTILIEIVIEIDKKHIMCLYYEDHILSLKLDENDNFKYIDKIAKMVFQEGGNCKEINVYDRYSIETLDIEYGSEGYNAIEKVFIYANGLVKPAIKLHRKVFDSNWMGYKYHCIMEKPEGKERE